MSKVTDALLDLLATRSKQKQTIRALLGDGTGTVAVENTESYAWVRPYGRDMPVRAYGPTYRTAAHDLPVRLEVISLGARIIHRIVGIDDTMYIGTPIPGGWGSDVPTHAAQHQMSTGGHDLVFIDQAQLLPLLMYANDPADMTIYVAPGNWWSGTSLRFWSGGVSEDLTGELPSSGYGKYLLFYLTAEGDLEFVESAEFLDVAGLHPSPYELKLSLPANTLPLGAVLLLDTTTAIDQSQVFSYRNIVSTVSPTNVLTDTLMLAALADGLYMSTGGSWSEIDPTNTYLENIEHIAIINETTWVVFREQSAASGSDPLVYKTDDSGTTWVQAQTGISYTQGAHIWKVCALWQPSNNSSHLAIVIANTDSDVTPQVFVSVDAGENWFEISNTGLPATVQADDEWPVSLAVEDPVAASFTACLSMWTDGIYYVSLPTGWAKKTAVTEDVFAVIEDHTGDDCWWAATENVWAHTDDAWATFDEYEADTDQPSDLLHTLAQHPSIATQLVVGGYTYGVCSTTDGETFEQQDGQKIGKVGVVLARCSGDTNKVFATDDSGNLYMSSDGGLSTFQRLSVAGVQAFAALAVAEAEAALSVLEMWLKV